MSRVISVHKYNLRDEATPEAFEAAIQKAQTEDLLTLPGLEDYDLLRGMKARGLTATGRSGSTKAAPPGWPSGARRTIRWRTRITRKTGKSGRTRCWHRI